MEVGAWIRVVAMLRGIGHGIRVVGYASGVGAGSCFLLSSIISSTCAPDTPFDQEQSELEGAV